jgi:hypothetical protein
MISETLCSDPGIDSTLVKLSAFVFSENYIGT